MKHPLSLWLCCCLDDVSSNCGNHIQPALTDIASAFSVNAEQTSQTLSLYFFAFALGVVFWGRMCDTFAARLFWRVY